MSFKETDFTGLIGYLKGLLASEKDPVLFKQMVSKLVEIYDQLPVYPGIVNMCLGQAQKVVDPKDLKEGQKVYITTDEDGDNSYVSGIVTKNADDSVTLKDIISVQEGTEAEMDTCLISKAVVINDNVVNELWPSLVFDKEQNK